MCNLYRMRSGISEMAALFGLAEARANLPAFDAIYPDRSAPLIVSQDNRAALIEAQWGLPAWRDGMRPITNVRNLDSGYWRNLLAGPGNRCLVPVTAFCEWEGEAGSKRKVWFGLKDSPLFAFAGLVRGGAEGPRFAFLTTEPNELVRPVHPKSMPVILGPDRYAAWMEGGEAQALAQPFPAEAMEIAERE